MTIESIKSKGAGIALIGALALASFALARWPLIQKSGLSALTLAIVLGMLVGNFILGARESRFTAGITFGKQTLLRFGIVLYGLRLTFQDIAHVGIAGLAIDGIMLSCTFLLAWWAGTRWFHLDRTTAMLIGAGSAICGAAAVMATDPVVRGRADQVAVAVATVVVFGTSAIFLYPYLYHLNLAHHLVAMSAGAYGIFAGSTIHEVAQVVAAGRAVSDSAADTAVITKMVRVMMLAPFLLMLSAYLARSASDAPARAGAERRRRRRRRRRHAGALEDQHSLVRAVVRGGGRAALRGASAGAPDDCGRGPRHVHSRDGHGRARPDDPSVGHRERGPEADRARRIAVRMVDRRRCGGEYRDRPDAVAGRL